MNDGLIRNYRSTLRLAEDYHKGAFNDNKPGEEDGIITFGFDLSVLGENIKRQGVVSKMRIIRWGRNI